MREPRPHGTSCVRMFRLLFWNLHRESRALELAHELCRSRDVDLFIAAEVPSNAAGLQRSEAARLSYRVHGSELRVEECAAYDERLVSPRIPSISDHLPGEVRSRAIGDKLEHSFYVRSTDVDYRYLLFKVRHAIDGFPVELLDLGRDGLEPTKLAGRAEFEDALRAIFGRNSTRSVVARMRDLAREVG